MMSDDDILAEFRAADALLEGHFILSSGLRSPRYLQCARVLMDGARAERLAQALAVKLPAELRVTAESEDGVIMAIEHASLPLAAVQFHPESILTLENDSGLRLVRNVVAQLAKARE